MKFGEILQTLLYEEGMTQAELAHAIGLSQRTISKWVTNLSEPTASSIYKVAKFFDVSADYLLGLDNEYGCKC